MRKTWKAVTAMSYRDQVRTWVSNLQRNCGQYIPNDFPMSFFSADVSDNVLYDRAMDLYRMAKASQMQLRMQARPRQEAPENEMLHLVPYTNAEGNVYFVNRFTNGVVVTLTRQTNGLYAYHGPRAYMTILGGRGELSGIYDRLDRDNDYFHDVKGKGGR